MREKIYGAFYAVSFFVAWAGVGFACHTPLPEPNAISVTDTDAGTEACIRFARENCPCLDGGRE